jgi:hypothetical protein
MMLLHQANRALTVALLRPSATSSKQIISKCSSLNTCLSSSTLFRWFSEQRRLKLHRFPSKSSDNLELQAQQIISQEKSTQPHAQEIADDIEDAEESPSASNEAISGAPDAEIPRNSLKKIRNKAKSRHEEEDDDDFSLNIRFAPDSVQRFSEEAIIAEEKSIDAGFSGMDLTTEISGKDLTQENSKKKKVIGQSIGGEKLDSFDVFNMSNSVLTEQFTKGSGKGGQKVNKSSNCVILRHEPTGTVVKCHATRSLQQNRVLARKIMQERLEELMMGQSTRKALQADKERRRKDRRRRKREKKMKEKGGAEQEIGENEAMGTEQVESDRLAAAGKEENLDDVEEEGEEAGKEDLEQQPAAAAEEGEEVERYEEKEESLYGLSAQARLEAEYSAQQASLEASQPSIQAKRRKSLQELDLSLQRLQDYDEKQRRRASKFNIKSKFSAANRIVE